METLERDGFKFVNFFKGEVAKISGFKNDVGIFERVKKTNYKKTIEEWKELYKK